MPDRIRAARALLLLAGGLSVRIAKAQTGTIRRVVADTAWQRLTGAPAYAYRTTVETAQVPPPRPSPFSAVLSSLLYWLNSTAGQIVLWGLLGGLALYLTYHIVSGHGRFSFRKKPAAAAAPAATLQPDSLDDDWASLATNAAAAGDYRHAVRFSYRLLLQRLAAADLIQYQTQKSDAAYAAELRATPHGEPFQPLRRRYEQVWFGGYPVSADAYGRYREGINNLLHQLPA